VAVGPGGLRRRPSFTGANLTKFRYNVEKSLPWNPVKSELRYSNPFLNARATNEGE